MEFFLNFYDIMILRGCCKRINQFRSKKSKFSTSYQFGRTVVDGVFGKVFFEADEAKFMNAQFPQNFTCRGNP